jgi:hypothetical protein
MAYMRQRQPKKVDQDVTNNPAMVLGHARVWSPCIARPPRTSLAGGNCPVLLTGTFGCAAYGGRQDARLEPKYIQTPPSSTVVQAQRCSVRLRAFAQARHVTRPLERGPNRVTPASPG